MILTCINYLGEPAAGSSFVWDRLGIFERPAGDLRAHDGPQNKSTLSNGEHSKEVLNGTNPICATLRDDGTLLVLLLGVTASAKLS